MKSAFDLIPGKKMSWTINQNSSTTYENWEVFTDSLNHSYIYCYESKEIAYKLITDIIIEKH